MTKKTLLTILMTVPLMIHAEMVDTSVSRLDNLSTVLAKQFDSKPRVRDVNALPNEVLDIDVNGKQIQLAWDLHEAVGVETAGAEKAIHAYANQLADEAVAESGGGDDGLESQKTKSQEAQVHQGEKIRQDAPEDNAQASQGEQTAGSVATASTAQVDDDDVESYAVNTPIKFNGKIWKKEVICTPEEAEGLKGFGVLA